MLWYKNQTLRPAAPLLSLAVEAIILYHKIRSKNC
jgi:hypothetical protein